METTFRTVLRYGLDPANQPEQGIRELVVFAKQARIQEVMFLITAEERSFGHTTLEEVRPWTDVIKKAKAALSEIKVDISLNPWTTLYQIQRGRHLHEGQDFRLMVGETGATHALTPCPLCPEWQQYLADYFSFLVKETEPVALWIEDDWRLHNHDSALGFGGCFCPHHMELLSGMVGATVTRESLLRNILSPGTAHPWRDAWLQLSRRTLLEPAEHVTKAIKKTYSQARVGLMSSGPDTHSMEGRDWNRLMDAFSQGDRYLIRPHMPPYTQATALNTFPSVTRHTIANLDKPADIYPEMESSPRCGQYSKAHKYVAWEMLNSALIGCNGVTLNHFDNMGMNTFYDPSLGTALGTYRPRLEALSALQLSDARACGPRVLFHPDIAAHRHSSDARRMDGLYNASATWSKVFYPLGISHGFTKEIIPRSGQVYAVSDQTLRAFTDSQVEDLLTNVVLLDAVSASILQERGFAAQTGIESIQQVGLNETGYAIEELCGHDPARYEGLSARMCAQRCAANLCKMTPRSGAEVRSVIKNGNLDPLFPGSLVYKNNSGGTVFTTAYPFTEGAQFFMAYFNVVRQRFFKDLLFAATDQEECIAIADEHPVQLHALKTNRGLLCALTNVTYDVAESVVLNLRPSQVSRRNISMLSKDGCWNAATPRIELTNGIARIYVEEPLLPLDLCCLLIS